MTLFFDVVCGVCRKGFPCGTNFRKNSLFKQKSFFAEDTILFYDRTQLFSQRGQFFYEKNSFYREPTFLLKMHFRRGRQNIFADRSRFAFENAAKSVIFLPNGQNGQTNKTGKAAQGGAGESCLGALSAGRAFGGEKCNADGGKAKIEGKNNRKNGVKRLKNMGTA